MTFKRFGKKVLQIFLIIFIVLFLIGLSLFIHHQITKESVENYLPTGAQAYIEIESFRDFYNDVIDLKALEIILAQDKLSSFFNAIIDFKNNKYSNSFLFQELLNLKIYIILQNDFSPALIIDPGIKGIFTKFIPLFLNRLISENLEISTSILEGETIYTIIYKENQHYYFLFKKNLILVALEKEHLIPMLDAGKSGEGIVIRNRLKEIEIANVKDSILNLFVEADSFLANIIEKDSFPDKLLSMIDFPKLSSISLALSNRNITIKASADIISENQQLNNFLGYNAEPLGVISTLPDTTNIYTSVNFKSFKELYEILSTFQDDFFIEDYDSFLQFISGLTSDDILFSWTGSEAGLFTIETAPEPVLFVKIANEGTLDKVLDSLDSSIALNINETLIIDDIRVNQFQYPGIIKAGMAIAKRSSDLPFFIKYKDYLFLSMNPETLAHLVHKDRVGELLVKEKTYQSITEKIPKNANFFFYYDLNSAMPRFITQSDLLTQLLKEYEKGVLSLFYTQDKISFNLSAESSNSNRTTLFPGYPRETEGIKSPVLVTDITGGEAKEFIYLTDNNELVISDITNTPLSRFPVNQNASITLLPDKKLLIYDSEGILYNIDGKGEIVNPFPQFTDAKDSFPPLLTGTGIILFSSVKKQIQNYSLSGSLISSIDVPKTVFSQPLLMGNKIYYYPKSLMGNIYGSTLSGDPLEGWPQSSKGVSFSTPFNVSGNIGFLTQKGELYVWDPEGNVLEGFPVKLNGVYYSTPVVLNDRNPLIALISSEGLLSLVNDKGEVVASRQFDKLNSKDTKLALAQINESESPLIFIYGGSNYMTAVNDNLQILSGFPINGYTKPSFSDINNDGSVEVISAGYDKKFYIYTLRENQ